MSKTTKNYGSKFKHKFDGDYYEGADHQEYRQRKQEKRLKSILRSGNISKESFKQIDDYAEED